MIRNFQNKIIIITVITVLAIVIPSLYYVSGADKKMTASTSDNVVFNFYNQTSGQYSEGLKLIGNNFTIWMGQPLSMDYHNIMKVSDPVNTYDAANKHYVDTHEHHRLVSQWDVEKTWTNIGTSFVDIYLTPNSNDHSIQIDTNGYTQFQYQILWNKPNTDSGTETCRLIDSSTISIMFTTSSLVSGINTGSDLPIPIILQNSAKDYKLQCKSTSGNDDPSFLGARIWLRP